MEIPREILEEIQKDLGPPDEIEEDEPQREEQIDLAALPPINADAIRENGRDSCTYGFCARHLLGGVVDMAKIPYFGASCFRCWGKDSSEFWRGWMKLQFGAVRAVPPGAKLETYQRKATAKTLSVIKRAIKDPCTVRAHVLNAVDGAFLTGYAKDRDLFESWRVHMHKEIEAMAVTVVSAAPPQQLTLRLFGR